MSCLYTKPEQQKWGDTHLSLQDFAGRGQVGSRSEQRWKFGKIGE
jgi:hypothetical protein